MIAILVAFVFGLVVGTWLRRSLDRPVRYLAARTASPHSISGAPHPGDVRHAAPRVLVTRQHEEQVG